MFNIQAHISPSCGNKEIVLFRGPIGTCAVLGEETACAVVQAPRLGAGQPMGLWVPAGPHRGQADAAGRAEPVSIL